MKKLTTFAAIFFFLTTLVLGYILVFVGTAKIVDNSDDTRQTVMYPKDLKDLVMSEMRDYLEVIGEIQQGLAENNPDKVIKAAHRQGQASIDDTPARLLKISPIPCKTMGFKGHHLFQAIEDSARANFNTATVNKQLAELTNNCVVCHRTYKVILE